MHLSIVTHGRLIGDYHAQHPFVAYTLHDRAGTLASASLLYKAEKPSVCPSVCLSVCPSVCLSVTSLTWLPLHRTTWDLVYAQLWSLACVCTLK